MSLPRWAVTRGFVSHRWPTAAATTSPPPGRDRRRWLGSKAPPPKREAFREDDVEERFTKGGGPGDNTARRVPYPKLHLFTAAATNPPPGGQKINKVMSCVQLKHLPTGISVECQQFRALTANRQRARSLLQEKLDLLAVGVRGPRSRPRPRPRPRPRTHASARARAQFGKESKAGMRIIKAQKKKAAKKARTKRKYNSPKEAGGPKPVPAQRSAAVSDREGG